MLPKWFAAIWLDTWPLEKGISSIQLAKDIGVTQKMAWHMLQRIRHAAGNNPAGMLGGVGESDETCLGGKEKNKHALKRTKTKHVAFGITEHGGDARAFQVESASAGQVLPRVLENMSCAV